MVCTKTIEMNRKLGHGRKETTSMDKLACGVDKYLEVGVGLHETTGS